MGYYLVDSYGKSPLILCGKIQLSGELRMLSRGMGILLVVGVSVKDLVEQVEVVLQGLPLVQGVSVPRTFIRSNLRLHGRSRSRACISSPAFSYSNCSNSAPVRYLYQSLHQRTSVKRSDATFVCELLCTLGTHMK